MARKVSALLTTLLFAAVLAIASGVRADPDALWRIVHDQCVPDQEKAGKPEPCANVDIKGKYAVLKDRRGKLQYLLIPIDRISGIESPAILSPDTPNYWQEAWLARHYMEALAKKPIPRNDIALAINSAISRSQNQLHIHIDCVRPKVKAILHQNEQKIGNKWAKLQVALEGHDYLTMRVEAEDLSAINPFKSLANGVPGAASEMGNQTLAVVGASFKDGKNGFYLLTDRASLEKGDLAWGEELLDHDCKVLDEARK